MNGSFGSALRISTAVIALLLVSPMAGHTQTSGGTAGGGTTGASPGTTGASPGTTGASPGTTGAAPGTTGAAPGTAAPGDMTAPGGAGPPINTGPLGPGGTRIAPGPSGADIQRQTIGPGGTPVAPGGAGTLGSGPAGPPAGPSTRAATNCVPDTTGAPSRSSTTTGLGPQPTIAAAEPGRPVDPGGSGQGALPRC